MRKKVISVIIIIIITTILIVLGNKEKLFEYNLMEILTTSIVTVGIYILTQFNDDIAKKNEKIEIIIGLIIKNIHKTFDKDIDVNRYGEYLYKFKYLDNKIQILDKLSEHLDCKEDILEIKREMDKINIFITENIGQGNEYFKGATVKDKIPNIVSNIENRLDKISTKIYNK